MTNRNHHTLLHFTYYTYFTYFTYYIHILHIIHIIHIDIYTCLFNEAKYVANPSLQGSKSSIFPRCRCGGPNAQPSRDGPTDDLDEIDPGEARVITRSLRSGKEPLHKIMINNSDYDDISD